MLRIGNRKEDLVIKIYVDIEYIKTDEKGIKSRNGG